MADNFENIPVDITAEELVERVKKPIDNKPKSGSKNFITSGGVYDATADKVFIFSATIRSYADFDALFQNENIDASKAIFEILISGLGEVASVLGGGASLWGIISNNTLLLLNKENGEKWLYFNGSSLLEKHLVKKGGIEADSITPWELDRVYVEYDGKWTVSTFAELNDILPENYSSVLQAFSFPKNSELYNAVNGTNFIALHEVFINTDNGKVWKYSNGSFTTKSLISKSRIVSKVDDLNELFDEDVDVLNVFTVLGYSTLPNSQYYATKVVYSTGLNGYLMTDVVNGKTYFYNRKSGEFKNFSTETSAGLNLTHISGYNEAETDEIAKTTLSGDGIIFVDGGGQTNYIIIHQTDSSGWIKQTKLIFGKYNDTRSSGIYWRQYGSGNWTDWVGFVDAELNEESENPVMNKVVAQALKNVGGGDSKLPEKATTGQIFRVAETDEEGNVVAVEAVDRENFLLDGWRTITNISIDEETTNIVVTQDDEGNPFELNEVRVYAQVKTVDNLNAGFSCTARADAEEQDKDWKYHISSSAATIKSSDSYNARIMYHIYKITLGRWAVESVYASSSVPQQRQPVYITPMKYPAGSYFTFLTEDVDMIRQIKLWGTFAAGSEIEVIGR